MIAQLLSTEVQEFIRIHENDDPANLMLRAKQFSHIPLREAIEQIQSRKKAKHKLPTWYNTEGLIYPPPLSLEQCSSELTAQYKASHCQGKTFADLTGGMGIDFYHLSKVFQRGHYVEKQAKLVTLAQHNMRCLGVNSAIFHEAEAYDFLYQTDTVYDLVFLDPARRGVYDQKVFLLKDCEPDLLNLLPLIKRKSQKILVKASPLLDIKGAIADLGGVTEVHVVVVNNDVKEILFFIDSNNSFNPKIKAIDLQRDECFEFLLNEEEQAQAQLAPAEDYLYEPNAALLKAGAFKLPALRFGLKKLHPNSQLYTSARLIPDFPGRVFRVSKSVHLSGKELKQLIPQMKANITVRNYPMSVNQIRKKTGLKDGGHIYLFGTTDMQGKKVLLCEKVE